MSPDFDDLRGCHGRLFARDHIDGDGDRDDYGCDHRSDEDVAGSLGEGFAFGRVVLFALGLLTEQTHSAPILSRTAPRELRIQAVKGRIKAAAATPPGIHPALVC